MKVCLKLTPFQSVVAKEVYAKVDLIWCIMLWTILIVKYTDSFEFVYNFKEIRDKNKNKAFKICSVGIPSDSRLRESFGWGSISCYFLLFFFIIIGRLFFCNFFLHNSSETYSQRIVNKYLDVQWLHICKRFELCGSPILVCSLIGKCMHLPFIWIIVCLTI